MAIWETVIQISRTIIYEKLHSVSRQNCATNTIIISGKQRRLSTDLFEENFIIAREAARCVAFQKKKEIVSHAIMVGISRGDYLPPKEDLSLFVSVATWKRT